MEHKKHMKSESNKETGTRIIVKYAHLEELRVYVNGSLYDGKDITDKKLHITIKQSRDHIRDMTASEIYSDIIAKSGQQKMWQWFPPYEFDFECSIDVLQTSIIVITIKYKKMHPSINIYAGENHAYNLKITEKLSVIGYNSFRKLISIVIIMLMLQLLIVTLLCFFYGGIKGIIFILVLEMIILLPILFYMLKYKREAKMVLNKESNTGEGYHDSN